MSVVEQLTLAASNNGFTLGEVIMMLVGFSFCAGLCCRFLFDAVSWLIQKAAQLVHKRKM